MEYLHKYFHVLLPVTTFSTQTDRQTDTQENTDYILGVSVEKNNAEPTEMCPINIFLIANLFYCQLFMR